MYKLQPTCQFHQGNKPVKIKFVATTFAYKPVNDKFAQSTGNKSVDNLLQTCCQQAVAIYANASRYRLFVTSLLQDVKRIVAA